MKKNNLKWNLDDVCKHDKFEELMNEVEKDSRKMEGWWKKLSPTMTEKVFKEFIEFDQELDDKFSRLGYLPELMESTNNKDAKARLWKAKVNDLALAHNLRTRKIGHWLKGLNIEGKEKLDDENATRLFKAVLDMEYALNYSRLEAKHTLSEKEEEIIDNKDVTGGQVISDLRGLIEADFEYKMGKKIVKTQGELLKFVHSNKAKERKEAYEALLLKHKDNADKLFVIYQAVVKDWAFETKKRGYKSAIARRNFGNQVLDKAVETLLRVCSEEKKVFYKFFDYKAKQLGSKKLSRMDLYAPISPKVSKAIKFEEAKKLVLDSFYEFSQKFGDAGKQILDEQHVDVMPDKDKRNGAFCATVGPKITPYVLLNFVGTSRDVSTLAHELGHGIHSLYANKHYPVTQQAQLPLAETASTLGEMILFEKMLSQEKDKKIRNQMLVEKIGDTYATVLRQNYFVKFEIEAHNKLAIGATAEEINKIYQENLKEQFGNSMVIPEIFKYEWLYVSHFFETPFYCYAYNFGELLSLSLYARYKKEGNSFVPKIEKILEAGGSEEPAKILKEVGVDIEDENFWRESFGVVKGWVDMLL
ncbi:M3 family oligoendopeptidase [Candidatus Shapirobacteria bacterium]|nr:M3 family oligoendopeptidase [Candidatus Shapirobacteria bacterium]